MHEDNALLIAHLLDTSALLQAKADTIKQIEAERDLAQQNYEAQRRNTTAFYEENIRLRTCLAFFASVIKHGEPWNAICEQEYLKAIN